ncbi:MAG: NAD(P)-binding domain-containing protein [Pseudonocardiaceae bacterium]
MIDCAVVGGGPAGLATSAALTERGVEHQVLERGRVGQTWRTQRWDSFRLNTPGWANAMLGEQPPDAFAPATEVVVRLEKLAPQSPVREGVEVIGLDPVGAGYTLRTTGDEASARTVVVATGHENVPYPPSLAQAFPERIAQYHTADYRTPAALPAGGVLVVGSAQSGCQIAEDLLAAGRRVVLATSPVGRVPVGHRRQDVFGLLFEAGFFHQRPADLPDPAMMRAAQPVFAPGERGLSLPGLARAGAVLAGRLITVDGEQAHFDGSAPDNVAAGAAFAAQVRGMLDQLIARAGRDVPPAEPDPLDAPVELHPPAVLDLREIGSVVWCTGFRGEFGVSPAAR